MLMIAYSVGIVGIGAIGGFYRFERRNGETSFVRIVTTC
jgi:hypothetical protein